MVSIPAGGVKKRGRGKENYCPLSQGPNLSLEDNFLKSSRRVSSSLHQISSDNPQKDTFHNLTFLLTRDIFCDCLLNTTDHKGVVA